MASFKASRHWLKNWQKKYAIVSRKITKVVSKKNATPQATEQVQQELEQFRRNFKAAVEGRDKSTIFNTDQSGFNPEMLSGRTLEVKGTHKVFSVIRSQHSRTHSYTAQFMISASGELKAPLFLILQEVGGVFGERVARTMLRHVEAYVVASSSGNITKKILKKWFLEVYLPNAGEDSVLLLDSLSTYRDRVEIDREKPDDQDYTIITIPPGLTGHAQPLDVYFNRPYKHFIRTISDHINFNHEEIKLHVRDTIIKLHVLVHNQFRSPRFKRFIKHAWKKSGLIDAEERGEDDDDVPYFDDPNGYCFHKLNILENACATCDKKPSFIRCAWCTKYFCFEHFYGDFNNFHFCEQYDQML